MVRTKRELNSLHLRLTGMVMSGRSKCGSDISRSACFGLLLNGSMQVTFADIFYSAHP